MSATSSILVAVRSAIIDGLSNDADLTDDLADVLVEFQWSRGDTRERIFTRNARATHAPAAMRSGRNVRDEVGTFEVVVLVIGPSMDAEESAQRALDLGAVLEDWIAERKNNELGVVGMQTLQVAGDLTLAEMFNENGTLAEFAIPVRYTARLT